MTPNDILLYSEMALFTIIRDNTAIISLWQIETNKSYSYTLFRESLQHRARMGKFPSNPSPGELREFIRRGCRKSVRDRGDEGHQKNKAV